MGTQVQPLFLNASTRITQDAGGNLHPRINLALGEHGT